MGSGWRNHHPGIGSGWWWVFAHLCPLLIELRKPLLANAGMRNQRDGCQCLTGTALDSLCPSHPVSFLLSKCTSSHYAFRLVRCVFQKIGEWILDDGTNCADVVCVVVEKAHPSVLFEPLCDQCIARLPVFPLCVLPKLPLMFCLLSSDPFSFFRFPFSCLLFRELLHIWHR